MFSSLRQAEDELLLNYPFSHKEDILIPGFETPRNTDNDEIIKDAILPESEIHKAYRFVIDLLHYFAPDTLIVEEVAPLTEATRQEIRNAIRYINNQRLCAMMWVRKEAIDNWLFAGIYCGTTYMGERWQAYLNLDYTERKLFPPLSSGEDDYEPVDMPDISDIQLIMDTASEALIDWYERYQ
jgi:hypothetical protein